MAVSFSSSDSLVSFYSFNFWDCNLIPFLPPTYPCPLSWKFTASFFHQLLHVFANTYIFLNITCCVHIMLLNTYVFSIDHLALDNKSVSSSLEIYFPAPSLTWLPVVLCVGLKPQRFPPNSCSMACQLVSHLSSSKFGLSLMVLHR